MLDAERVREFLESSANQLTYYGLFELFREVKPNSLCAFFRNCHFGVMHNHDGELFVLLTDQGYANEPSVVWEKLCEVDGDVLVGSDFAPSLAAAAACASDQLWWAGSPTWRVTGTLASGTVIGSIRQEPSCTVCQEVKMLTWLSLCSCSERRASACRKTELGQLQGSR